MSYHTTFSRDLVIRKVQHLFRPEQWAEVFRILDFDDTPLNQGGQDWKARLQLAMLKLSDGDLGELKKAAQLAKIDDRELLTLAEYPSLLHNGEIDLSRQDPEADRRQYLDWLDEPVVPHD